MRSIGYGEAMAEGVSVSACASVAAAGPLPTLPRKRGRELSASRCYRARETDNHLFKIIQRIEARLRRDVRRHDDVGEL